MSADDLRKRGRAVPGLGQATGRQGFGYGSDYRGRRRGFVCFRSISPWRAGGDQFGLCLDGQLICTTATHATSSRVATLSVLSH